MGASAGTVTLELDANSVRLLRDLKKTQKATQRTARKMRSSMTNSFNAIRNAAVITFGVQIVRSVAEAGMSMERFERGLKVVTGSAAAASREFAFVTKEAKRLGLDLELTASSYTRLAAASKGSALAGQGVRDIFVAVAEASTVMGLSGEQMTNTLVAIEQMISKGTVASEELKKQLGNVLPGAFSIAARAMGVTTQKLGKMLEMGEITAEDMLPKLAIELRRTFGPGVADAVNSAAASFNRLKTSIFEVKAALADSGLLDSLSEFANRLAFVISPSDEQRFASLTDRARELRAEIDMMISGSGGSQATLDFINAAIVPQLVEIENELDAIIAKRKEAIRLDGIGEIIARPREQDTSFFDSARKSGIKRRQEEVTRIRESLKSDLQLFFEYKNRLQELVETTDLSAEEAAAAIQNMADDIEESAKGMVAPAEESFKEIDIYARQAARNMQDSLAEFLFDPFKDGLRGMVSGFIDAMRKMLANQLAARFFKMLGNQGGFLGSIFGGARATGGAVSTGQSFLVGEQGPELFTPGANGFITPNSKLSQNNGTVVTQTFHFEAGADIATIRQEIIPLLEQTKQVTIAEINQMRLEGFA